MKLRPRNTDKSGFTLIEILSVLAITALLATVILGNMLPAREKGNDTKRKADIDQMGVAVRLYYERYGSFPSYDQDVGVGNAIDDDLAQFIHVSKDPRSPDQEYHYNSNENCPLAGGAGTVVMYAIVADSAHGNWQDVCDSSGPADRYVIISN